MQKRYILWTGGWDSTFCVIQALRTSDEVVQPIYLVDPHRPSTATELQTIEQMQAMIVEQFPDAADRLLPLKIDPIRHQDTAPVLKESLEAVRKIIHLGDQYPWIAQYLNDHDLTGVDLAVEARGRIRELLQDYIAGDIIDPAHRGTDVWNLFGRYRFPIIHLSKWDSLEIAKEAGFLDILNISWFCHTPLMGRPCGTCNPCKDATKKGFGWRIPFWTRYPSQLRNMLRTLWRKLRGRG
ncbi:hypothetical protein [Roseobacter sp. S98]|uniref:hypothetical protein n=1 Tax=Roseobacter algicola (ex Choi et al. 2025) (nom. illeg.) TaxID=3092138 RepID=UPI003F519139